MKFTVKARLGEKTYTINYEVLPSGRYQLSGDRLAVDLVRITARKLDGHPMGPINIYTDYNHLKEPLSVIPVIEEVFDEIVEVTGDVPEAPDVPEGAIS